MLRSHSRPIRCKILLEASMSSSWGRGHPEYICTWGQNSRLSFEVCGFGENQTFYTQYFSPETVMSQSFLVRIWCFPQKNIILSTHRSLYL